MENNLFLKLFILTNRKNLIPNRFRRSQRDSQFHYQFFFFFKKKRINFMMKKIEDKSLTYSSMPIKIIDARKTIGIVT
jgi:hypothetical protein